MTVAAIIPHWNRRDLLSELLDNLKQQTRQFDQVIVADNGSTDDSAALAEKAGARVLRIGKNMGFAGAVNRGIEAADSDWIAILNNDVKLKADWLEVLLQHAAEKGACFAAGKTLVAGRPEIIDGTFDEIARSGCPWRCGAGRSDSTVWSLPRPIRIAPMTAALFRRSLFGEVGFLDENFGSYLEDVDFGIRCALSGRSGVFVPGAVAYHRGSSTFGRWNKDTVRLLARNQVVLAAKYLGGQRLWPILAGQLLWGFVALRHGRALAYLKGKAEGLWVARSRWKYGKFSPEQVRILVEESERTIFELQRQSGFDRYWRVYFWLSRR